MAVPLPPEAAARGAVAPRARWWRTALAVVTVVLLCLFSATFSPLGSRFGAPPASGETPTGADTLLMLATFVAIAVVCVVVARRHRAHPAWPAAAGVLALALPIGPAPAWILLASSIGRRGWADLNAKISMGLVAATSLAVTLLDWRAQPRGASFLKSLFGPVNGSPTQHLELGVEVPLICWLLGFGLAVGLGVLSHSRRETRQAREEASTIHATSRALGDEVARREERELIAREVHDALGHRLSLLNLHAGALEATAGDNPRLAESARLVRESATGALDDLRSLLDVLAEPGRNREDIPLTQLAQVVREAFGAGAPLGSSIFILDADQADPTLSRAVYRIVQELLTNTRKHAPGAPAQLTVEGGPERGIDIECRNPLLGAPDASAGRGLTGVGERVSLLRGTFTAGPDPQGREFVASIHLPWRSRPATK